MTTTADRRAADHLIAAAFELEAGAADLRCKAEQLIGGTAVQIMLHQQNARHFRYCAAGARQDAEQVPHHSEVE